MTVQKVLKSVSLGMSGLALSVILSARADAAEKTQWVGKPTGRVSCANTPLQQTTSLGDAIRELEGSKIEVVEAKVARLAGRTYCMACDCPDGSYNVMKVKQSAQVEQVLNQQTEWEKLQSSDIIPENARLTIFNEDEAASPQPSL
jgi:hypothetical protein